MNHSDRKPPKGGSADPDSDSKPERKNFIEQIVDEEVASGKNGGRVHTRFPPEPNGFLHIGHAKAICVTFGIAASRGGVTNLRFDDTNPSKESDEFVQGIVEDIRWLGWDWDDRQFFASDYFETLYGFAERLIEGGFAYVCDLSGDETREHRGTLTEPGKNSPFRDRSPRENLDLFRRMKAGEFEPGARSLRAKIDMASPNLNMRDPVMYRIMDVVHHRVGDAWKVYPTYDWTHGQSDALEGITHSLCSLEFENHRPLYDWFLDRLIELGVEFPSRPRQIEFARLQLTYTVMSKRKLRRLVEDGHVAGWDDPRMPTLCGLRRRGFTPASIRAFSDQIGVAKHNSVIDRVVLDNALRDDLNPRARRFMGVVDPVKVVVTNWPEGKVDEVDAINNPEDPAAGTRKVPFSGTLFIERDDFREEAPRKYFRLTIGREVRFRYAYYLTATGCTKDSDGNVTEVQCTYDPESRGGNTEDGRKVKGTIHWVSADQAIDAEVRLYDHLFVEMQPDASDQDLTELLNPESLLVRAAKVEPSVANIEPGETFQFERLGYFCIDARNRSESIVINRAVGLRDSWAKIEKKGG